MPSLRPATVADLGHLVDVLLECWSVNYSSVMSEPLVEGMTRERATRIIVDALADSALDILVASSSDGETVGFCGYCVQADGVGYVSSLYVSPRAQGTGAGRLLLLQAQAELGKRGAERAQLWVFKANLPSQRFYRRCGWEADGREVTLPEWGEPQIGMSRALTKPAG